MELSPLPVIVFLISLLPVTHAHVSPKAVASIEPHTHVYKDDLVILTCDIQGGGDAKWTYSWYKDNDILPRNIFNELFGDDTMQKYIIFSADDSDSGYYTCRGQKNDSQSSEISEAVTLTVSEKPLPVLSVSTQSWLNEGDSVTLRCEITDFHTDWIFSWHRNYEEMRNSSGEIMYGESYTISHTTHNHTGVYFCRAEREKSSMRLTANQQPLWITSESPPVSLIINPSRTQHFTNDSLSLSCEDQSNSTGWAVKRFTHTGGVFNFSLWESHSYLLDFVWWELISESTYETTSLSTSYTGVYWCHSESGENSNPVNITVHDGDVILESPVHPVTEGHPLTLRCLYRNTNSSNLRADFYKDGSVFKTQTTGEMIIHKVSKSYEGFYHCKHPERGESPKSWVSVRGSGPLVVEDAKGSSHILSVSELKEASGLEAGSLVEAPFSVLMLICSVVTASPYLVVTIILLLKCYRARAHTDGERIENAVIEE